MVLGWNGAIYRPVYFNISMGGCYYYSFLLANSKLHKLCVYSIKKKCICLWKGPSFVSPTVYIACQYHTLLCSFLNAFDPPRRVVIKLVKYALSAANEYKGELFPGRLVPLSNSFLQLHTQKLLAEIPSNAQCVSSVCQPVVV